MKTEKAYYKNSNVVKWKRITYSENHMVSFLIGYGSSYECTYNEQGKVLTFKSSNGNSYECTYNKQGQQLTYKHSDGFSCERTYNEQGEKLTYKNSDGIYEIKGKKVSKEEFDSIVNEEIIEVNGIKYKRI
jgi:YD repeat-containing protein